MYSFLGKRTESGFSFFVGDENSVVHSYSARELHRVVCADSPQQPWFGLVLPENMLFKTYHTMQSAARTAE